MIIKYWSNGWNYIDNVSKIKSNKYEYKKTIEEAKIKIEATVGKVDKDDVDYSYDMFNAYVLEITENQIRDHIWDSHNRIDRKQKESMYNNNPLVSVVSFYNDKQDRFEVVMFFNPSFLLNDSGKTIDSL